MNNTLTQTEFDFQNQSQKQAVETGETNRQWFLSLFEKPAATPKINYEEKLGV